MPLLAVSMDTEPHFDSGTLQMTKSKTHISNGQITLMACTHWRRVVDKNEFMRRIAHTLKLFEVKSKMSGTLTWFNPQ